MEGIYPKTVQRSGGQMGHLSCAGNPLQKGVCTPIHSARLPPGTTHQETSGVGVVNPFTWVWGLRADLFGSPGAEAVSGWPPAGSLRGRLPLKANDGCVLFREKKSQANKMHVTCNLKLDIHSIYFSLGIYPPLNQCPEITAFPWARRSHKSPTFNTTLFHD